MATYFSNTFAPLDFVVCLKIISLILQCPVALLDIWSLVNFALVTNSELQLFSSTFLKISIFSFHFDLTMTWI
jgi:hypothetical protein